MRFWKFFVSDNAAMSPKREERHVELFLYAETMESGRNSSLAKRTDSTPKNENGNWSDKWIFKIFFKCFVRAQRCWQNGNPKVWRTDGLTGVGPRDDCAYKNKIQDFVQNPVILCEKCNFGSVLKMARQSKLIHLISGAKIK